MSVTDLVRAVAMTTERCEIDRIEYICKVVKKHVPWNGKKLLKSVYDHDNYALMNKTYALNLILICEPYYNCILSTYLIYFIYIYILYHISYIS